MGGRVFKATRGRSQEKERSMKTVIATTIALYAMSSLAAGSIAKAKLTPEQKQQIIMMKVGGFIAQPIKTTIVKIYNTQTDVPAEEIAEIAEAMRKGPHFPVEITTSKWDSDPVKEQGVGFAIAVFRDDSSPTKLVCAPDDGWAKINVAPFLADKPDGKKLADRVKREIWRGLAYSLGAGNTQNPLCALKPVASVKDLDGLTGITSAPETLVPISEWAKHWGINASRTVTYKKACEEGWAPAPTNEYQKAIWDKVHALPTAPIKIKPEAKKVRE